MAFSLTSREKRSLCLLAALVLLGLAGFYLL